MLDGTLFQPIRSCRWELRDGSLALTLEKVPAVVDFWWCAALASSEESKVEALYETRTQKIEQGCATFSLMYQFILTDALPQKFLRTPSRLYSWRISLEVESGPWPDLLSFGDI